MAKKFGEDHFREMVEKGPRELAGIFFHDSNIAVPMYPLRGTYAPPKEADSIEPDKPEQSFEELHPVGPRRDDLGRDDPGIERE